MRIALAGTGRLGTSLLRALLQSQHEIVAIVQNGRTCKGYRRWLYPTMGQYSGDNVSVSGMGKRNGIPTLYIDKMDDDELAPLRALEPDLLLVGGFAIILKKKLLDVPVVGCLNTHSSLLPMHRGPNPFTATILAGDTETGVTFHGMDEGIDTGPVVAQYPMSISAEDSAGSLYERAAVVAGEHILEVLDGIATGGICGTAQGADEGCYDQKLEKEDLFIHWEQPAEIIDRFIRACYPFSMARFRCGKHIVFVTKATFDDAPTDADPGTVLKNTRGATIATGRGTLRILVGFCKTPVPWTWPGLFNRPGIGERVT
jgi:methionyl-tRNA formyltransferase